MSRLLFAAAIALGLTTLPAHTIAKDRKGATSTSQTAKTAKTAPKKAARAAKRRKKSAYAARRSRILPVVKAASTGGLPAGLVDAIITKESRYDVNARGSSGEIGLMQILPSTARGIAKKLGKHSVARLPEAKLRAHLTVPANNIRFGVVYLRTCHKMARGDIAATVGCYNAGPANMWRWSKIRITRNYVSFVRSHMANDG